MDITNIIMFADDRGGEWIRGTMVANWNTIGREESVLIRGVSSFQGLNVRTVFWERRKCPY